MPASRPTFLIVLLAGCASTTGSSLFTMDPAERERLTLSSQPPAHESCQLATTSPPSPATLLDTAALAAHARSLLQPMDYFVGTVEWDSTGALTTLATVETSLGDAEAHALMEYTKASLRIPPGTSARSRLRIDGDGRMRTAASVFCRPHLTNEETVTRMLIHMATAADMIDYVPTARTAVVQLRVLSTGVTEEWRVFGSTGYPELDAIALEAAKHARYLPASIDGVPQEVWVRQPMYFRLTRDPAPRRGN